MFFKENKAVENAYNILRFLESNNNVAKMINIWEKKYLKTAKDKKQVKELLNEIILMLMNGTDNIQLMDDMSSKFIAISKYVDEEASKELSKILEKI